MPTLNSSTNEMIYRLLSQVDKIIEEETPDYYHIDSDDLHTHTIDDIPQLQMLFNNNLIDSIYDKGYNENSKCGYIYYNTGLLINYGEFKYNNNLTETSILFPVSYVGKNAYYNLHYNKVLEYDKDHSAFEPIDSTYNIIIISKNPNGFVIKSPQLYIPETVKYNYITIGDAQYIKKESEELN